MMVRSLLLMHHLLSLCKQPQLTLYQEGEEAVMVVLAALI